MSSTSPGGKPGTYLLVLDLPEMMEAYERVGLQIPDAAFFKERQCHLQSMLAKSIPECKLETVEGNKLVNKIASLLNELLRVTPEAVVISTVPAVAAKMDGHCLQINRIVDKNGEYIGVGARPRHASPANQFSDIKNCLDHRPVILVEDGSFSGGTMKCMLEMCRKRGIEVKHLVVGFLFPKAMQSLQEVFPNKANIHCWRCEDFVDWMPDHDFFPFVPNAGKVVGYSFNGQPLPAYLHNHLSLCMPYVKPYGNPELWASVPRDKAHLFSLFCVRETRHMFEEMENLNHQPITLECLLETYPHVSLPVGTGDGEFPHIKARIIDILHDDERDLT